MSNFQHFLVTRINVDWNISKPKPQEVRNSLEFLDHRFNIFEKTCYPSVNSQTNQNFIWLILLDSKTPNLFKERIQSYASSIKIIPIYIQGKETLLSELKAVITENTPPSVTHLITTNLDSDDIISKKFIATIQAQFKEQEFEFINLLFGYLYQIDEQRLFLREWLTAPCHTLIETYQKGKTYETVLNYSHDQIVANQTQHIATEPMWLMTVHGQNVRTKFDVAAAWQPLSRLGDHFNSEINFPKKSFFPTVQDLFQETFKTISSRRSWDTPKVKVRKVINILFPELIRLNRAIRYSRQ